MTTTNEVAIAEVKKEVIQQVAEKGQILTSGTHVEITIGDLFLKLFADPYNVLIFFSLILIGIGMKRSKIVPDWAIIFSMPIFGMFLSLSLRATLGNLHPSVSIMVGACDGILAFFSHQFLKQTLESPVGPFLLNFNIGGIPIIRILVAIVDESLLAPAIERHETKIRKLEGTGDGTSMKLEPKKDE